MASRWSPEEDQLLKELAGKLSAAEIGTVLGRTVFAVRCRIQKLGLDGRLSGEAHWASKIPNLVAGMIGVLHDGGYTPKEIQVVLKEQHDVTYRYVHSICSKRNRAKSAVRPACHLNNLESNDHGNRRSNRSYPPENQPVPSEGRC